MPLLPIILAFLPGGKPHPTCIRGEPLGIRRGSPTVSVCHPGSIPLNNPSCLCAISKTVHTIGTRSSHALTGPVRIHADSSCSFFLLNRSCIGPGSASDGLPHRVGMSETGSQSVKTVPAGFLHADPAVKTAIPQDLED